MPTETPHQHQQPERATDQDQLAGSELDTPTPSEAGNPVDGMNIFQAQFMIREAKDALIKLGAYDHTGEDGHQISGDPEEDLAKNHPETQQLNTACLSSQNHQKTRSCYSKVILWINYKNLLS